MRVLVAEDFEVLARSIGTGLRREGMAVDVVLDGDDALEHLAVTRYDVVVLDRDLPGVHGAEVCRRFTAAGGGRRARARRIPPQSRWPSPSWSPGSGRWPGGPPRACRRYWSPLI